MQAMTKEQAYFYSMIRTQSKKKRTCLHSECNKSFMSDSAGNRYCTSHKRHLSTKGILAETMFNGGY